jgi:hypothetical protein
LLSTFSPQHIANTAWAYATLGILNTPLMDGLIAAALAPGMLDYFIPQEIANLMWAVADRLMLNFIII